MTAPTIVYWDLLVASPDVAKAFGATRPEIANTAAVHLVMSDREYVIVEGGETLEIQRTGQANELGEDILVFTAATAPISISDDQFAERRRVHAMAQDFMRALAAGKVQPSQGLRMSVMPQVVRDYLRKKPEEQRQWIALEATTDEWDAFLTAIESMPEPESSSVWTLFVLRPHRDVVDARHPSRKPRGSA